MHTVILLAAGIALAYFSKPQDRKSYQMAVLAILGIAYFCIWRFTEYYVTIFEVDDNVRNTGFLLLMLAVVGVSLLPIVLKVTRVYAISLAILFFLLVIITFSFERNIKNIIATSGGFFSDSIIQISNQNISNSSRLYEHKEGGFSLTIPNSWHMKTHGSGLSYFEKVINNKKQVELRPRCFHNVDLSLAEILKNIVNLDKSNNLLVDKKCNRINNRLYTCYVKSVGEKTAKIKEQWRWIVTDKSQNQNIELDFIFYVQNKSIKYEAEAIISSLKFNTLPSPLPLCVSPIEWF